MNEKNGELLSNCCAFDFDAFGFEKETGIWQERCLKCGKLCEPVWINNNDIKNIANCIKWNQENKQQTPDEKVLDYLERALLIIKRLQKDKNSNLSEEFEWGILDKEVIEIAKLLQRETNK
jgi:hypothetical protein